MRWAAISQGLLAAAVVVATSQQLPDLIGKRGTALFALLVAAAQTFNAARIVALRTEAQPTAKE